jgi:hypothetical protein
MLESRIASHLIFFERVQWGYDDNNLVWLSEERHNKRHCLAAKPRSRGKRAVKAELEGYPRIMRRKFVADFGAYRGRAVSAFTRRIGIVARLLKQRGGAARVSSSRDWTAGIEEGGRI